MTWKKEEEDILKEKYSQNISLSVLSQEIGRSIRAIQHKALRMHISRPRFPSNKPSNKQPRKVTDRKYYLNNTEKVYQRKMERRKRLKEMLVNILRGKCEKCGYSKCIAALDFHHKEGKETALAVLIKDSSEQKALKEVKKCILLCANCHREHHYRVRSLTAE